MKKKNIIIILLLVLIVAALAGALVYMSTRQETIENAGQAVNGVEKRTYLEYKGDQYPLKRHLQTVLLLGTDSNSDSVEEVPEGFEAFYNFSQADFLVVLVMDIDAGTTEIIQLNRDTMTDVRWLDVLGNPAGTNYEQLCLAFNSGSGGEDSCKNTLLTVSDLMFHAPIQNYIQIPMSAISTINDLVGGVPVTIRDDMTVVDPAFVAGKEVMLNGKQAESFVRARSSLLNDTNVARMARQREYLESFQKQAKKALNNDGDFIVKALKAMDPYLRTDMTVQQLADFLDRLDKNELPPIRHPEGKLELKEYYEFYVDQNSLWEIVKNAYCD